MGKTQFIEMDTIFTWASDYIIFVTIIPKCSVKKNNETFTP